MQNFAWNHEYIQPYESSWMILSKLTLLNQLPISNLFNSARLGTQTIISSNLLHMLPEGAAKMLDLNRRHRYFASIYPYLQTGETGILTSKTLRICPECIDELYHSPIYQILFIEKCPIHNVRLVDHCVACNEKLGSYKLTDRHIGYKYICAKCKNNLFGDYESDLFDNLLKHRTQSCDNNIKSVVEFLINRKKLRQSSCININFDGIRRSNDETEKLIKNLSQYYSVMLNDSHQETNGFYYYNVYGPLAEEKTGVIDEENKYDYHISAVYRSMRNMIFNRYIRGKHKKCYYSIVKSLQWITTFREYEGVQICPVVYAYILWRMFIEKIDWPGGLQSKALHRRRSKPLIEGVYMETPESCWASSRTFATLAFGLFKEFIDIAAKRVDDKCINFHPELLQPTIDKAPYFEARIGKDHIDQISLHFWTNTSKSIDFLISKYDRCFTDLLTESLKTMKYQFIGTRSNV